MSKDQYIIATDLGSQSIKTALYNQKGEAIEILYKNTRLHDIGHGNLVYFGDETYQMTLENIKNTLEKSKINNKRVLVLSFTGMGAGLIGVDNDWNATTEFLSPIDSRDSKYLKQIIKKSGKFIRKISGTSSPVGLGKIVWLKNDFPDVYKNTKKFMLLTQYVQGKLCNAKSEDAFWEKTTPTFSGMVDVIRNVWSSEICEELKIDINKLPKLVEPTDLVGYLNKKDAAYCGLVQGIPIVASAYDKACDSLSSGANDNGSLVDNSGTYPALVACINNYSPYIENLDFQPSAVRGLWLAAFYIIGGGLTLEWFKDSFINYEIDKSKKLKIDSLKLLDNKISNIPIGSNGIFFIPHLGGQAMPKNPYIRGAWIGFNWSNNKDHFYKSILESVGYEFSYILQILKSKFPEIHFKKIKVIGGGANSNVWNKIKADILGLDYQVLNRNDFTTLGAAIIGGKSIGLFKDMKKTANNFIKIKETIKCDLKINNEYKYFIKKYRNLHKHIIKIFNDLSKNN